jgi:general secretion pathway protein I
MNQRGFTLLEVLVATTVMAIAVVGLLSSLSTSMNGAARLTEYDRAALVARRRMDELLADPRVRPGAVLQGALDPVQSGGLEGGWRARVMVFERRPDAGPGSPVLQRMELEVWWMAGERRRVFKLEGFRRDLLFPGDAPGAPLE